VRFDEQGSKEVLEKGRNVMGVYEVVIITKVQLYTPTVIVTVAGAYKLLFVGLCVYFSVNVRHVFIDPRERK
jgi:hypothetical protein